MAEAPCPTCNGNSGRNLVVCISGTLNHFSRRHANVIELYSRLVKDNDQQLTFFDTGGLGMCAMASWTRYLKRIFIDRPIELAFALQFETGIIDAYRWLSKVYEPGDRIYLFGFSRGAYQIRALAGMIETVGLMYRGNDMQIPFAFELYSRVCHTRHQKLLGWIMDKVFKFLYGDPKKSASLFKEAFCHDDVKVHFVGAWDTVSSIGLVRSNKDLPLVNDMKHVCYFRHALALDERRVKFLPLYARGGASLSPEEEKKLLCGLQEAAGHDSNKEDVPRNSEDAYIDNDDSVAEPSDSEISSSSTSPGSLRGVRLLDQPHTKEVWFSGTHQDIGGGNVEDWSLDSYGPALRWMIHEAMLAGLQVSDVRTKWTGVNAEEVKIVHESLTPAWWPIEMLPFKCLSYETMYSITRLPHLGARRRVAVGQFIHESVGSLTKAYKSQMPKQYLTNDDSNLVDVVDAAFVEPDFASQIITHMSNNRGLMKRSTSQRWDDEVVHSLMHLHNISLIPQGQLSLREVEHCADGLYKILCNLPEELDDDKRVIARLIMSTLNNFAQRSGFGFVDAPSATQKMLEEGTEEEKEVAQTFLQYQAGRGVLTA